MSKPNREALFSKMERSSGTKREPKVRLGVSSGGTRTGGARRHHPP